MSLPKTTESISISVPSWLVEEIDAYCELHDYTRSKFMTRAVRKYLWNKLESVELWEQRYDNRNQSE